MHRLLLPIGLSFISVVGCSDPTAHEVTNDDVADEGLDGLDATLIVRTHHDQQGVFGYDEELVLPDGDRIALERAEPSHTATLVTGSGERRSIEQGKYQVRVHGERHGNILLATHVEKRDGEDGVVRQVAQPLLDVFGERKTLILLIGFPDDPNTYDPDAMHAGVFGSGQSTDELYRSASRDKMWLGGITNPEGDVWGPYEAPTDGCSSLTYSEVSDLALAAAEEDGIDVDAYQHRIYSFPPVDSCPGGGIGGGNQVWVFGITPQYIWDWVGHEASHGFGFGHASSYDDCTIAGDPVTMGGACEHNEYGDPTDVMGSRNFQFSTWHMERAGWLEAENVAVVDASRRITIAPLEGASDEVQSVRVPRDNGEFFHFEYRQPVGFDAGLEAELTNGVLVRVVADPDERDNPHLLDMTPETSTNLDAALEVGSSFEDGNMRVTVVEANENHAVLDVTVDGIPPDTGTGGMTGGGAGSGGTGGGVATGGNSASGGTATGGVPADGMGTGGTALDGGTADGVVTGTHDNAGCGCRVAPRPQSAPFALLGIFFLAWRRRLRSRLRSS